MQKSLGCIDKTDEATQNIDKKASTRGPTTAHFYHRLHIIIYNASKMSLSRAKTGLRKGAAHQRPRLAEQNVRLNKISCLKKGKCAE